MKKLELAREVFLESPMSSLDFFVLSFYIEMKSIHGLKLRVRNVIYENYDFEPTVWIKWKPSHALGGDLLRFLSSADIDVEEVQENGGMFIGYICLKSEDSINLHFLANITKLIKRYFPGEFRQRNTYREWKDWQGTKKKNLGSRWDVWFKDVWGKINWVYVLKFDREKEKIKFPYTSEKAIESYIQNLGRENGLFDRNYENTYTNLINKFLNLDKIEIPLLKISSNTSILIISLPLIGIILSILLIFNLRIIKDKIEDKQFETWIIFDAKGILENFLAWAWIGFILISPVLIIAFCIYAAVDLYLAGSSANSVGVFLIIIECFLLLVLIQLVKKINTEIRFMRKSKRVSKRKDIEASGGQSP